MILRFLYAFKFKFNEAYEGLKAYYEWHETQLPVILTHKIIRCLVNILINKYRKMGSLGYSEEISFIGQ